MFDEGKEPKPRGVGYNLKELTREPGEKVKLAFEKGKTLTSRAEQ